MNSPLVLAFVQNFDTKWKETDMFHSYNYKDLKYNNNTSI